MHLLPLISPHPSGSDLRCDHHQREWILDLILEDIVLEVEAQHVDAYDSDESCEFGAPDPYDEFIAHPDLSRYEDSAEDSATLHEALLAHRLLEEKNTELDALAAIDRIMFGRPGPTPSPLSSAATPGVDLSFLSSSPHKVSP